MYTFLNGSKLLFDYGSSFRQLDVESITLDQTFQETNYPVKTLQERIMVDESIVQKRAIANFSFAYYLSDDGRDGHIMEWFLDKDGSNYNMPMISTGNALPQVSFYLETREGKKIKVNGAVVENVDFELGPDKLTRITVTGSAELLEVVDSIPVLPRHPKPASYLGNHPLIIHVNNTDLGARGLLNTSLSIRKDVEWLDQPTIHSSEAGEIYTPSIPIYTNLSISGRIVTVLDTNLIEEDTKSIRIQAGSFDINLEHCSTSDRIGVDRYFTKTTDFKVRPIVGTYYLTY